MPAFYPHNLNKKVSISGISITTVNKEEIIDVLIGFAAGDCIRTAFYLNAHCLNVAFKDAEYKRILQNANLVYAGGKGIVWASWFLGSPLTERVNILDFFDMLVIELKDKKTSIYLLGCEESIVQKAAENLRKKGLNIIGAKNGFFEETEERDIIHEINRLKPDILMVGMGVPRQEKWIDRHLNELDVNLCWGVGAVFDWFSGYRKRAPKWMVNCGLEWLHRLYQQPKRLWKRYLVGNPIFIYRVLKYKITKG